MEHHFHTEIAVKYGVEEAVIIYNLAYWITHNKANNKNFYDGYYWTYNSARAFEELFPYFNSKKISRLLNKLEEVGAIKSGNYNKVAYDRTKWYTISDEELIKFYKLGEKDKSEKSISQKCPMEKTEMENGIDKSVQPIPNNKPDNKPNEKQHIKVCVENSEITDKQVEYRKEVESKKLIIKDLIVLNRLNLNIDKITKECKGNFDLVIQNIKTVCQNRSEFGNLEGAIMSSIKDGGYEIKIKPDKASKSEFEFNQERFDRIVKLVEVADISALTNKDRDYYNKCQEYLRG